MRRRVAITGIGVVAPGGNGTKEFWDGISAGRTATRAISLFNADGYRSRIAAECDFDPAAAGLTPREIRRMDRAGQRAAAVLFLGSAANGNITGEDLAVAGGR